MSVLARDESYDCKPAVALPDCLADLVAAALHLHHELASGRSSIDAFCLQRYNITQAEAHAKLENFCMSSSWPC
eukprot:3052411-Pleurochrysis_carterae.AAC.3